MLNLYHRINSLGIELFLGDFIKYSFNISLPYELIFSKTCYDAKHS